MIRTHHFIAWLQIEGLGNDVQSGRCIDNIHYVIGMGAQIGGQCGSCSCHSVAEFAIQKAYWLTLQFQLNALVLIKHRTRASARRSVVQETDIGF